MWMEVFVAKQPIFTLNERVYAYEILYRNNGENHFPDIDGDDATADVIINSFLNIGIDELSNGKPCFINFTEKLLKRKLPTMFKPKEIVVEILENVEPSLELLEVCQELKAMGYTIALDDFVMNEKNPFFYALIRYVDIIKVDFRQSSSLERRNIEKLAKSAGIQLLAEKIETREEYKQACLAGYHYFQGYFFAEPVLVSSKVVPTYFYTYYEIMRHLSGSEPNPKIISKLIEQDLSLSYKLLKLINSPGLRPKQKIKSIHQAVILLGFTEMKKWISILSVRETIEKRNDAVKEMIALALVRAKCCELLSPFHKKDVPAASYFITGLYSLMDALLKLPMEKIVSELPLDDRICDALTGKQNELKDILDIAIVVEKGDWQKLSAACLHFEIKETDVLASYQKALNWSNQILRVETDPVEL
ncbi:EAL and HDOD domain-containing protein [Neobacillus sp. SM06]|uniref:EAL and HDOD domain-containing protein n=1 Tax=Neobacillus sp. SM06 TaxID=3422492 RepID=UPI003D2D0EC7